MSNMCDNDRDIYMPLLYKFVLKKTGIMLCEITQYHVIMSAHSFISIQARKKYFLNVIKQTAIV